MPDREAGTATLMIGESNYEIHGCSGDYIFELIKTSGDFYEASLLRTLHYALPLGVNGWFVDVGANIGNHTLYFALAMGANVLAVEPIEENLAYLRKNIDSNGVGTCVEVAPFAAWNMTEDLKLQQSVENNSGTFRIDTEGNFVAKGRKLDDLLDGSPVALIKIDVEGAELEVIEGALNTIEKWQPLLIVEAHSAEAVQHHRYLLEPLGYHLVSILGRSDNYIWVSSEEKATRIREEMSVISHRREQRKLNSSLDRQKSLLQNLSEKVEASEVVGAYGQGAMSPEVIEKPGEAKALERKLDEIQTDIKNLDANDPNVTLQLTQLAVEIGRHSASTVENTRRLNEFVSQFEANMTQLESVANHQSFFQTQLVEVLERLDSKRLQDLLLSPFIQKIEGLESDLDALSEDFEETHALVHATSQKKYNQLVELLEQMKDLVRTDDRRQYSNRRQISLHQRRSELEFQLGNLEALLSRALDEKPEPETLGNSTEIRDWASDFHEQLSLFLFQDQEHASTSEVDEFETLKKQRDSVLVAYQKLSERFERVNPGMWDTNVAMRALGRSMLSNSSQPAGLTEETNKNSLNDNGFSVQGVGSLKALKHRATSYRQRVRVGIASMPGREHTLSKVLHRVAPQADEVFVYLNNMDEIPAVCSTVPDNVHFFTGPDLGDRGKFRFLDGFTGYYFTVDDDIDYSRYHVLSLINAIERYGRKAIVGWHGSIFKQPFDNFYDPASRQVLTFGSLRGQDTPVHLLGTGVSGFHTDSIDLSFEDFQKPNMADVFLATQAKTQNVKMIVIAHEKGEATPLETLGSISDASLGKKDHGKETLDVGKVVTSLVQHNEPWPKLSGPLTPKKRAFKVAIVGRTNPNRWKKGGILKSCLLTRQMLLPYGCTVHLADIVDGDPIGLEGFRPDVVMVYVGDPERPDFSEVHKIVEHHADLGTPVLVNLSEDSHPGRTKAIAEVMNRWHSRYAGLVKMMAFTTSVQNVFEYRDFAENIVTIPKTLTFEHQNFAEYETSAGIFIGDIAKLSDPRIVDQNVEEYISSLRKAIPEAKIYAVQQYQPRFKVPSGIDEVWPFLPQGELAERLLSIRLMVNFAKFATFEMVPVETAAMGVPILHRNMPQSLNTVLGLSAIQFTDSEDLAFTSSTLYRDPVIWRQFSKASIKITEAQDFDLASAQMYMALHRIAARHNSNL